MSKRPPFKPSARHLQRVRELVDFGPREIGKPEPGYFKLRVIKRGVLVGAQIRFERPRDPETGDYLDRSWYWHGDIGVWTDPRPSPAPSDRTWRIWLSGERIARAEYDFMIADLRWRRDHDPRSPFAQPWIPVDLSTLDPTTLF